MGKELLRVHEQSIQKMYMEITNANAFKTFYPTLIFDKSGHQKYFKDLLETFVSRYLLSEMLLYCG